jgi:hypothetical protein
MLNNADGLRDVLTANGEDILDVTFFTDEAWFHLSGYVNSQNSRVWSATTPHEIKDTPFRDLKVGVWCPISRNRIIVPIFLDDTINSERYCEAILHPFIGHLNEDEIASGYVQQDGAAAHTARVSMTLLRDEFRNRTISKSMYMKHEARKLYSPSLQQYYQLLTKPLHCIRLLRIIQDEPEVTVHLHCKR